MNRLLLLVSIILFFFTPCCASEFHQIQEEGDNGELSEFFKLSYCPQKQMDQESLKEQVSQEVYHYEIEPPLNSRFGVFPFRIFLKSTQNLENLKEKESGKFFAHAGLLAAQELIMNPTKSFIERDVFFGSLTTGIAYGYVTACAKLVECKSVCIISVSSPKLIDFKRI